MISFNGNKSIDYVRVPQLLWLAALLCAVNSGHVNASCFAMASAPYEMIYCEVIEQGKGKNLPNFAEFQRNTPRIQALLLKRPASKLGISIDVARVTEKPANDFNRRKAYQKPAQVIRNNQQTENRSEHTDPDPVGNKGSGGHLPLGKTVAQACRQHSGEIVCGKQQFLLVRNKHNRELASGVLGTNNRMGLPQFRGSANDETGMQDYLSEAYHQYIVKMLEIGLGGVTMSYSRFYYTYQTYLQHRADFVQRLEMMYQYLKKDKQHLAVGSGGAPAFKSLEYCMSIDASLIVCDNSRRNWVYQRKGA